MKVLPFLPLAAAFCFPSSLAYAQTLPVDTFAAAMDQSTVAVSELGVPAQASVADWAPRLPLDPAVELTEVYVDSSISLEGTVTVRNPTANVVTGTVSFQFSYYSVGGQGNWGGIDASNYTEFVSASDMQPGETRTLPTWRVTDRSVRTHIEMSADPWSDVKRDVLGTGPVDYSLGTNVRLENVTNGLEIVSATLSAEASGVMAVRGVLSPATGVVNYCPSTVNTSGQRAELAAFGAPYPGSTGFSVLSTGLPAQSPAVLFAATSPASTPVAGGTICIGGARVFQSTVLPVPSGGTVVFEAPLDDALPGTKVYAQAFFREPTGFSLSNALEIQL